MRCRWCNALLHNEGAEFCDAFCMDNWLLARLRYMPLAVEDAIDIQKRAERMAAAARG